VVLGPELQRQREIISVTKTNLGGFGRRPGPVVERIEVRSTRQRAQILAGWSKKSEESELVDALQAVFAMNSLLNAQVRWPVYDGNLRRPPPGQGVRA
jgi:hypothetical protein